MDSITIDPTQACRGFFVIAALTGISINSIIPLRKYLISYGPRSIPIHEKATPSVPPEKKSTPLTVLASLAQVPHSWFVHYYVASVASSLFWAYQISTKGAAFRYLALKCGGDSQPTMTINQVVITWILLAFQGIRRLYECIEINGSSEAQMPLTTWAAGLAFYFVLGVSIWVEGSPALMISPPLLENIAFSKPSLRTCVAVLLFLLASGIQHQCHMYLASLRKYTLPEHPLFKRVLCPHYTSECAIYFALAMVAAPHGQILNMTVSGAFIFTATNLAITAESTRQWYAKKFGPEKVQTRWRMLPFLY